MTDSKAVAFHIVGDAFVDLFSFLHGDWPEKGGDAQLDSPIQTFAGGSSTNTTTHLNILHRYFAEKGESTEIVLHTILNPSDHYGGILLQHAKEHGFPLINCKQAEDNSATGHCVAIVAGQERSFMTYRGCVDNFHADHLDVERVIALEAHLHLHIAGFFNLSGFQNGHITKQIKHIQKARKEKFPHLLTVVSLVPQHDATKLWDGGIDELATCLDFLIMNDLEAMHIMRQGKIRRNEPAKSATTTETLIADCAAYFRKLSPKICVILTRGPSGAVALVDGKVVADQNTVKVVPIDPTGAGDSFAAGFLHGLWAWKRQSASTSSDGVVFAWPNEALRLGLLWGCAMGTSSVLVRGASIPSSKADIEKYRTEIDSLNP